MTWDRLSRPIRVRSGAAVVGCGCWADRRPPKHAATPTARIATVLFTVPFSSLRVGRPGPVSSSARSAGWGPARHRHSPAEWKVACTPGPAANQAEPRPGGRVRLAPVACLVMIAAGVPDCRPWYGPLAARRGLTHMPGLRFALSAAVLLC